MAEETPMQPAEQPAPEAAQPSQPEAVVTPPAPAPSPAAEGGGRRIGLIVALVLVLAIGAVVAGFLSSRRAGKSEVGQGSETPPVTQEDTMTTEYGQQSASDEVSAIESDLSSTSFDGIDQEMTEIDKELSKEE